MHSQILAKHAVLESLYESYRGLSLSVTSTGIVGHCDAKQELTGNGKDLHILTVISTGIVTAVR